MLPTNSAAIPPNLTTTAPSSSSVPPPALLKPKPDSPCMDTYLHIRVLFSMILGLGMSRLLGGVGRIVQHPRLYKVYWVHLVWTLFLFLYMIHFWWWEFRLVNIHVWTFPLYFFIALYAVLLVLLCVLFFPEEMADYTGFKDYFYKRFPVGATPGSIQSISIVCVNRKIISSTNRSAPIVREIGTISVSAGIFGIKCRE